MSEQLLATDSQCAAAPGSDGSTVRHHGSTKPAGGGVNAWIIYATILLTAIIFAIGQFKVPPTMTAAMADLGIGLTQGGLLMSIVAITAIVLALFGGMLTVRFRPKTLAISAICCALAGNLVGYAAPSFELLLFSRLLEGLGYGLQTAIMPTIIAEIFPENKRSIPMALYSMWVSIGMLFIFNFSNVLSVSWGWRSCWLFCAALFLVALVLFAFVVKEPQDSALGADGTTWQEQKRAIGIEAKNPSIWCLTLVFTIFGLGCSAFSTFAPTFCVQALGMDPAAANTDTGFLTFGMIAGALMMTGILAVYRRSRSVLLIVATVITGVFFALSFLLNAPCRSFPSAWSTASSCRPYRPSCSPCARRPPCSPGRWAWPWASRRRATIWAPSWARSPWAPSSSRRATTGSRRFPPWPSSPSSACWAPSGSTTS